MRGQDPTLQNEHPEDSESPADLTIDLTTPGTGESAAAAPVEGGSAGGTSGGRPSAVLGEPRLLLKPYEPDKQRDYVRLIVTIGLLSMFGWVIVWSCIESASWKDHWEQTKEMLQTILPALTGLIGSVIGFYFGSGVNQSNTNASHSKPTK